MGFGWGALLQFPVHLSEEMLSYGDKGVGRLAETRIMSFMTKFNTGLI